MIRTVHLHGALGKKYGKTHRLDAPAIAMLISGIDSRCPGFRREIAHGRWGVVLGDMEDPENREALTEGSVGMVLGDKDEHVHIIPEVVGAKEQGLFEFILGIVLIVVSVIIPGTQGWLTQIGIGLALSGASQLLAPTPTIGEGNEVDERASFIFNGPTNRSEQGGPVPLVYGQTRTGSTVISVGIDVEQVTHQDFGYNQSGYSSGAGNSDFGRVASV